MYVGLRVNKNKKKITKEKKVPFVYIIYLLIKSKQQMSLAWRNDQKFMLKFNFPYSENTKKFMMLKKSKNVFGSTLVWIPDLNSFYK